MVGTEQLGVRPPMSAASEKTPTITPAVQVETGSEADHGEVETPDKGRSRGRKRSKSVERARKEREVRR